jgi:hypothetical protein
MGIQRKRATDAPTVWCFLFGAIFGMVVGWYLNLAAHDWPRFVGGIAAGGLVGGFLSARFGAAVRHLAWFVP